MNNRVLIVGDLHIGLKNSNEEWLKIVLEVIKWVKNVALENNIEDIIIVGDFYHDRTEINLLAMDYAKKILDILLNYNLDVHLLIGNHDAYLKSSSEIHSLCLFKNIPNVFIYDKTTILKVKDNKTITFVPWGIEAKSIPKSDYIFGHFEIDTFKMGYKVCEGKTSASALLEKSSNIFTGHFHAKQERTYSNGKITYVGTPYEMDWNDINVDKFIHILDFQSKELISIKNNFSPKHLYIKGYNLDNITNNIIKFELEQELTPEQIAEINLQKPFKWEAIYKEKVTEGILEKNETTSTLQDVDKVKLFSEYINLLEIKDSDVKLKVNEKMEKLNLKIK